MFYENVEFQLTSFHITNQNNNAFINTKSSRKKNTFLSNNERNKKTCFINIILIGDKNIGKSKLIKQFTQNTFIRNKSFKKRKNSLNIIYKRNEQSNEEKIYLKFYRINLTYRNDCIDLISTCSLADCLLLTYDINNQISFNHLIDRCLPLIENSQLERICLYVLLGIKNNNSRQVTHSQVEILTRKFNLLSYEITSKTNYEDLIKEILDRYFEIRLKENILLNVLKKLNSLCGSYQSCFLL